MIYKIWDNWACHEMQSHFIRHPRIFHFLFHCMFFSPFDSFLLSFVLHIWWVHCYYYWDLLGIKVSKYPTFITTFTLLELLFRSVILFSVSELSIVLKVTRLKLLHNTLILNKDHTGLMKELALKNPSSSIPSLWICCRYFQSPSYVKSVKWKIC